MSTEKEKRNSTKLGRVVFSVLILLLVILIISPAKKQYEGKAEVIELSGYNLLSENDYLAFAKLHEISKLKNISLAVVKDRLEKHPYILRADVVFEGTKKIKAYITEKSIKALLIGGSDPFLVTSRFQLLPIFANTRSIDLPVISNPKYDEGLKSLSIIRTDEMIEAFRIIDAADVTDDKLFKKLAEINLRKGGDIVLTFSGLNYPVIFGRGNEAKKILTLRTVLNNQKNNFAEMSEYLDFRFSNAVYVGASYKTDNVE
jgi:cell division protein FtsQ